jgi:hypothetical protein
MSRGLPALCACTLLAGCAALQPKPVIENRFATSVGATDEPGFNGPLKLSVTSAASESPAKGIKLTELSDRGQAALITATDGKPPMAVTKAAEASSVDLRTSLSRVLVVSSIPNRFMTPGERVDAMRIELKVDSAKSAGWKIVGWSVAASKEKVIKVGDLTDEASSKFTATTGLDITKVLPSAEVGFEAARKTTSKFEVFDPSQLDAAVDSDGTAWVLQTGGWREDLAHNASIEVKVAYDGPTLVHPHAALSKLFEDEGERKGLPVAADKVRLSEARVVVPFNPVAICGKASAVYRVRSITNSKGIATFSEADDEVLFKSYSLGPVPFYLGPAVEAGLFQVYVGKAQLHYQPNDAAPPSVLNFTSYAQATQLIAWLQASGFSGPKLGAGAIGLLGPDLRLKPLSKQDLTNLAAGRDELASDELHCIGSGPVQQDQQAAK